jgi:hypothetical protein
MASLKQLRAIFDESDLGLILHRHHPQELYKLCHFDLIRVVPPLFVLLFRKKRGDITVISVVEY